MNIRHSLRLAKVLGAFWLLAANIEAKTPSSSEGQPPNIVIFFMDDMAYADIGPFGGDASLTPNLNQIANEGRRLTDFVVSSAVCSASRSALMTGCYHRRISIHGALGPTAKTGIHEDETTIAEICKSKGYATAMFGKWHLGHHPKFLPHRHGFDTYYGIPYSNDMWPRHPATLAKKARDPNAKSNWPNLPVIQATAEKGHRIVNDNMQPTDQQQFTKELTKRSVEFIKSHPTDPFFLYVPNPMPHVPLQVSDEFFGKSGKGLFADVMMEVDWSVGEIIDAIKDIGVERNTLVLFTSDNGPWLSYGDHAGSAGSLREGKGTMFEGGYREPTLVWWPGHVPAGTSCDTLCSTIDVLPTIAKLIGAESPELPIDGHDISNIWFGEDCGKSPHEAFVGYYGKGQLQTIRDDRFKLVFPHRYRSLNGSVGGTAGLPVKYTMLDAQQALYDLENDLSETTDVSDEHPEVVERLMKAADSYRAKFGDTLKGIKTGSEVRSPGKLLAGEEELPLVWP
ncbi:MAG: sulfatase [Planctomycetota bacterium]